MHQSSDPKLVGVSSHFTEKCLEFLDRRYMCTTKSALKLPSELKDLRKKQTAHHAAVTKDMINQWRGHLYTEIQDRLSHFQFYEAEQANYDKSPLKSIICRLEFILNSFLRQFVKLSIDDWVEFIRSFTKPDRSLGELWEVSPVPMLEIDLAFRAPEKEDPKAKEKAKKGKKDEPEEPAKEDGGKGVIFKPSLDKCEEFFYQGLEKMVESTNSIHCLEVDLLPFLGEQDAAKRAATKSPSFRLSDDFPWVVEAKAKI